MAAAVIELGTEPRVLSVAESIRAGQTAEIDAMKAMQERLGCTADRFAARPARDGRRSLQ